MIYSHSAIGLNWYQDRNCNTVRMVNMKRASLNSSKSSVLCSDHFEDACFDLGRRYVLNRMLSQPYLISRLVFRRIHPNQGISQKTFRFSKQPPRYCKDTSAKVFSTLISRRPLLLNTRKSKRVKWKSTTIMDCIKTWRRG
ncbi:uncharacterized protein LOC121419927 [Lytechinus variegatus]|uniref:uncharacterized protein LOC121419927 n=1 Tax=Lytechinus variegatus TaxID=7654 RepID=UPI001BB287DE|nr:uncharacterized protein LOC121419927 [Lytechinus variegatus]